MQPLPTDFEPVSLTVSAGGNASLTTALPGSSAPIVLHAPTTVIGTVSVATGSARNLHQLAVPTAALDTTAIFRRL